MAPPSAAALIAARTYLPSNATVTICEESVTRVVDRSVCPVLSESERCTVVGYWARNYL